jgi:hypothetical protein
LAEERVMSVHKVTGIISEVPVHLLDLIPALEKATEKQIKAAHDKLETEIYGAPLKNGIIPGDVAVEGPASEIANTEGGTA